MVLFDPQLTLDQPPAGLLEIDFSSDKHSGLVSRHPGDAATTEHREGVTVGDVGSDNLERARET